MSGPSRRVRRRREPAAASGRLGDAAAVARPVHELVDGAARRAPLDDAIVEGADVMSYRDLSRAADVVVARLLSLGGAENAPVAVRMPVCARQVAASLGILRAGGLLVWLGDGDLGERGKAVLAQTRPAFLLTAGPLEDELTRWYRDDQGGAVIDLAAPEPESAAEPPGAVLPAVGPDWTAYVAHTSGSTGPPKGVAQRHGSFAQFVTWLAEEFDLGPGSKVAQWVAPDHDPSLCEVFATLASGATLYPVPGRLRANPEKLVDWLVRERITFLQTVPSMGREIRRVISSSDPPLTELRALVLMGESLSGALANGLRAVLPRTRLANVYGPTETIAATCHEVTGVEGATVPIGRPIPGREVLVLDEADQPCPTGDVGEIVIRGACVADGYLGGVRPAAFRPVAVGDSRSSPAERCYRTGDLGRFRPDGLLEFRGRRDDQVKVAGVRMGITEIEAILAEHESVAECAVVAVVGEDGLVTRLTAHVVARGDGVGVPQAGAVTWRAWLREHFGASIGAVAFVTRHAPLPRTVAGKVDRRALAVADVRRDVVRTTTAPQESGPSTAEIVGRVIEAWPALVSAAGTDDVGSVDGDVPRLLGVLTRIRERFRVDVSASDWLADPTPTGLAALIEAAIRDRDHLDESVVRATRGRSES
ncbi:MULTISPECIES: AMP-binding protein [Actinoalloteichus]|uniref:AMP-binding enzyme C-terminal domain/AMP-binding enzyme n=1 Tax=Actinoalloteichus fjordicus TaxID=1612552 RepID=A0AAC9PT66_9PSEU|nr:MULTISPECIES: AMP-binding protein [Actinoalloteichus]APU15546.1 AMP-binding enzyme C-terminal domain/AMP-binding enzyme [Actinoalloteichus fjordicus]APU21613.1 AMP-binding enzyme C-terminal domain/AMP-binding enzyme [Actinoalloteichus sp. GBA129-24]